MAISVAVFVGDSKNWINELKDQLSVVKPGAWDDPKAGYGPIISKAAKERVLGLIAKGKEEGATCLLDAVTALLKDSQLVTGLGQHCSPMSPPIWPSIRKRFLARFSAASLLTHWLRLLS